MRKCFVIQPFDKGKFDTRYNDSIKPAIETVDGVEAYRVDNDKSVVVIIESIEKNICQSDIVVAEITTDNPNIWYELGFASALKKPVILLCNSRERKGNYPFDIRHRKIIDYRYDSKPNITQFENEITETLKILIQNPALYAPRITNNPSKYFNVKLSKNEFDCLAIIFANIDSKNNSIQENNLLKEMWKRNHNSISAKASIRKLIAKKMVEIAVVEESFNNDEYEILKITQKGLEFVLANEKEFTTNYKDIEFAQEFDDEGVPF